MDPSLESDVLNRRSLILTYRNYKNDTEYIAGWLAWTSEKCGYVRAITEPEPQQKAPRKRGKTGKARKPAKKTPDPVTPAQYPIRVSEFVEMAEHIASFDPKIEVPAALQKVFDRVILARSKVASWFEKGHSTDYVSNHRHSYFITVLEKAAKLLKPLIPETPVVSENIKLQNRFAGLTVEETDPLDELITEVKEKQLPKVDPIPIEQDEESLEHDFFFAIATFLDEIYDVRAWIVREWDEYRQTGEGLTRAAVLSNTAVDLVRSAENQFDQMLVRPKKYPAKEYPVWTLPALLYARLHDFWDPGDIKDNVDKLVKPSMRIRPNDHPCEQETYCMWHVYSGLKVFLLSQTGPLHTRQSHITRESFGSNADKIALEVFETLEWAQFFDVASHPHLSHFAVDETARGIKHMITFKEIPIWLTVAVQMFFDVESVFQEEGTLAAPFREYKETVRKAAQDFSKIDPIERPFERPFKGSADSDKKIASIFQNMRNILSDHQDYAIRDRWGRFIQKIKEDKHEPLSKTVDERDYVLKRHPIRCGLLKYELQLQLNHRASKIEHMAGDILYMAWLYVAVSRILHPEMPRWPDMEYLLNGRQDKLFFGEWPKTLDEVGKKIDLGRGYSIANKASNRRSKKDTWDNKQMRRLDDPTVIGELFLKRMGAEPKSTAEAHEWVMKLVSLVCKPESQKILDRQENLPQGTYETSEFLKSVELQRKPLALLGEIRQWLLADENDLHFDWFGMLSTCTDIWKTIMPAFRKNPVFKDDPNIYNWNVNTVITVLKTESIAQDMGTPMPIFEVVWETLKQFIQIPVSKESGSKTWKGDLHLAKLVDVCNPAMTLMNPGPVSFMILYANWSDEDKRDSRVGRAVWYAMQAFGARTGKEKNNRESVKEETDGEESVSEASAAEEPVNEEPADKEPVNDTPADEDEPSEHSGSQDDETAEIDEAASDAGSGISIQEFSLDLNALASQYKNGGNNIIFMGNKMKAPVAISRAQMGQLRTAPNGDFILPGGPPSRSSRVQMLPPRKSKRVRGVRAIATTEDAPDLCACGLSRYGVSVRPIPTMNTKAAKVEHQCMGALFEGIDVPDRDLGDAIKVTRRKIRGS